MNNSSSFNTVPLAANLLEKSFIKGMHIASAESLTGGLLADAFVSVPGASRVFCGSAVTYDIHAKSKILGVNSNLLQSEGAVCQDVAFQMAIGAAQIYRGSGWAYAEDCECYTDFPIIGLSTTGVAGPGPDGNKPAGLVYVGIFLPKVNAVMDSVKNAAHKELEDGCVSNVYDYDFAQIESQSVAKIARSSAAFVFELQLSGSRQEVRESAVFQLLRISNDLIAYVEDCK
ncbi:CinA family protein [Gardnerella sp. Marseille-Q9179]|uniref:CinA family protein n=1 Tax=Gardnerella sp. Marseille-Q9179 TaxID=3383028 RepID=UPI003AF6FFD6